jgi:uncharacterized protein (TIRG00374 family)
LKKRTALSILWLAVGLALLAWVIYRSDPGKTARAFVDSLSHPWLLAAAGLAFSTTQALFLAKWHLISRQAGARLDFRQSLHLFGTLTLIGTVTPGRAGELAVPLMMRGGGMLTGVALVNRILESTCTLCAGILAALVILNVETFANSLWGLGLVILLFVLAIILLGRRRYVAFLLGLVRACLAPFRRLRLIDWLFRLEEKYAAGIEHFYQANERLLRPAPILFFSFLMLVIWFLMVVGNYCLIQATVPPGEKEVTFVVVVAIIAVMAITMFVSPIPGGLGLSEVGVVTVLAQLGYSQNFMPFLLLARVGVYLAVGLLYAVSCIVGRELPEAPAPSSAANVPVAD